MYKLNYGRFTGKVVSIIRLEDGANIPPDEGNSDYQAFLKWNAGKPDKPDKFSVYRPDDVAPLDLDSTIPMVKPEPVRDLLKEIDLLKTEVANLK